MHDKHSVVCIVGPTATGKSGLSVALAKQIHGEVISADSMQIYRGFDIGTAKIQPHEMDGVCHHMLDVVPPYASFSVAQYCAMARPIMKKMMNECKVPILVGGTGLYIDSLLNGQEFEDMVNDIEYRISLQDMAAQYGNQHVWNMLNQIDPQWAQTLHPNNMRRIIRAMEIYHVTGKTMTQYAKDSTKKNPIHSVYIGLSYADRENLYKKINNRVDQMILNGLLDEIKGLLQSGVPRDCQAMQAIGYKELIPVLDGAISMEEAIDLIKRNSRRYAKRQLTWFKRNNQIHWIYVDQQDPKEQAMKILNLC